MKIESTNDLEVTPMTVNALDSLSDAERIAVINRTLTTDISENLIEATNLAISQGEDLYLPSGLWLVKANNSSQTGWKINIPDNQSLRIFGDGEATVVCRMATTTLDHTSPVVWIQANSGINLTFQNLLFDGNEANCPTHEGFTFAGDGSTTQFAYSLPNADAEKGHAVTLITDGVESIQSRGGFFREGEYPNRLIRFTVPPPVGTTIRYYKIYAHEQSANVKFARGSGTPNTIAFDHVVMTGCVGDGFHANTAIQNLQVTQWRSYGRTRRPRADIQLSRIPLQATQVTNFVGDAFESEPSEVNAEHTIHLSNMLVRGTFDLAGDKGQHVDGSPPNFVNVNAHDIVHLGQLGVGLAVSNFARVRGQFVKCAFVNTNRIQSCQVAFKECRFKILGQKDQSETADHIQIWHDKSSVRVEIETQVEFENVIFVCAPFVTKGYFVATTSTSNVNNVTRFINCRNLQQLEYFAFANRCGTMIFDGGQLSGTQAAIWIANGTGADEDGRPFITNAILKNPAHWMPSLVELKFVGPPTQVEMSGAFDAEAVSPIANTSVGTLPITWIGGFTGSVHSNPNGRIRGIPGLILRPVGTAEAWRYHHADTFASTEYELLT